MLALVLLVVIAMGSYLLRFSSTEPTVTKSAITGLVELPRNNAFTAEPKLKTAHLDFKFERANMAATTELSLDQLHWLREHGYLPPLTHQELSPDGLVWLKAMAESRDKAAIERYANYLALTAQPDAERWLTRSAAAGSTRALLQLARQALSPSNVGQADALTAAAWLNIAQQRGDPFAAIMLASIESPSPTAKVEARAELLAAQLALTSQQMGFDQPMFSTFPGRVPAQLELVLNAIER